MVHIFHRFPPVSIFLFIIKIFKYLAYLLLARGLPKMIPVRAILHAGQELTSIIFGRPSYQDVQLVILSRGKVFQK